MNGGMKRQSFFWSSFGAVAGGFTWLALTGIVIQQVWVTLAAVGISAVTLIAGCAAARKFPARVFTLSGLIIIWVVMANLVFIPVVYDAIPSTVGGMTTGKEVFSELGLMVLIALFSLLGFSFIIRDLKN